MLKGMPPGIPGLIIGGAELAADLVKSVSTRSRKNRGISKFRPLYVAVIGLLLPGSASRIS